MPATCALQPPNIGYAKRRSYAVIMKGGALKGGGWMLVTNEASNSVIVFSIDKATGKLSATNESLSVPKPVTVAFFSK